MQQEKQRWMQEKECQQVDLQQQSALIQQQQQQQDQQHQLLKQQYENQLQQQASEFAELKRRESEWKAQAETLQIELRELHDHNQVRILHFYIILIERFFSERKNPSKWVLHFFAEIVEREISIDRACFYSANKACFV